jgi:hypothetical protein
MQDKIFQTPASHKYKDESDINRLFHLMVMNVSDSSGRKGLKILESQSDWMNAMREKGPLSKSPASLPPGYTVKKVPFGREGQKVWRVENEDGEGVGFQSEQKKLAIENALEALKGVHEHPLLKEWFPIAIRRAIMEAVNDGSEFLIWSPGHDVIERWDLKKHLDALEYVKRKNDYRVIGWKEDKVVFDEKIKHGELDKHLPKEIAERIRKGEGKIIPGKEGEEGKLLRGDDLKIGGAWAYNLYDNQTPNTISDISGKELTPVDMEYKAASGSRKYLINQDLAIRPMSADPNSKFKSYTVYDKNNGNSVKFFDSEPTREANKDLAEKWIQQHTAPYALEITPDIRSKYIQAPEKIGETEASVKRIPGPEKKVEPVKVSEKKPEPVTEGETKVRGLSAGVEAKAIEKNLVQSLGDLPEYKTISMKEQAPHKRCPKR